MSGPRSALAGLVLLLLAGSGASAQVVTGRVVDAADARPLDVALVVLLDEVGERRGSTLSDAGGEFRLLAPAPGRYRVRVERIGYEDVESGVLDLSATDPVRLSLRALRRPIDVEGIDVEGERRCRVRPAEGELAARLWDEARKTLAITVWTQDARVLRFRTVDWKRSLDPRSLEIESERRTPRTGYHGGSPFVSLPAEDLQENGYIRQMEGGSVEYHAPDPSVLLSDPFLDAHCFRARLDDPPAEGWVGLAFEPIDRGGVPDIEGVLWLDRSSAELKRLEYGYTRLPEGLRTDRVGGTVEFDRIPDGPWIVRRWSIRTPLIGIRNLTGRGPGRFTREAVLVGLTETGGEVIGARTPEGAPLLAFARGAVPADPTAEAAEDRSRAGPPPGEATLPGGACPPVTDHEGGATLLGHVGRIMGGRGGDAVSAGADVDIPEPADVEEWEVVMTWETGRFLGRDMVERMTHSAWTRPARDGSFRICGLPPDEEITVRVEREGDPVGTPIMLSLRRGEVRQVELLTTAEGDEEEAAPEAEAVEAYVTVRDVETGEMLPDVSVRLDDGPWHATGLHGRVRIDAVEPGPHRLELRHVTFGTWSDSVEVQAPGPHHWLVDLVPRPIEMEPLVVTVASTGSRDRLSRGTRVDRMNRAEIIRRLEKGTRDVTDLMVGPELPFLRIVHTTFPHPASPGVRIEVPGVCVELARLRHAGSGCAMVSVYVNGVRLLHPELTLFAIDPQAVESIEVLQPTEATFRFGTGSGTGAILINLVGSGR